MYTLTVSSQSTIRRYITMSTISLYLHHYRSKSFSHDAHLSHHTIWPDLSWLIPLLMTPCITDLFDESTRCNSFLQVHFFIYFLTSFYFQMSSHLIPSHIKSSFRPTAHSIDLFRSLSHLLGLYTGQSSTLLDVKFVLNQNLAFSTIPLSPLLTITAPNSIKSEAHIFTEI